jgi:protein-S-isoprenylcysteine O-methyltransferase Ste14
MTSAKKIIKKSIFYSYTLVLSQFTCIALLIFFNQDMFIKTVPLLMFLSGISFFIYTILHNRVSNFNIIPDIKENALLITTGTYKYIRHPMYFAVLITMFAPLANSLNVTNLFICIVLTTTMFLKAKKEEHLWHIESPEYKKYMQNTKMIIPFIL